MEVLLIPLQIVFLVNTTTKGRKYRYGRIKNTIAVCFDSDIKTRYWHSHGLSDQLSATKPGLR